MLGRSTLFVLCVLCFWGAVAVCQEPKLELLNPVGGETFYTTRDTLVTIRWTGVDDTIAVKLEYTSSVDAKWTTIADSARGGQYLWNVAGLPPSTAYRVRVSQLRPPTPADNVVYSGHFAPVADAVWSPTEDRVASISAGVAIWDPTVSSSTPLLEVPIARAQYTSIQWSKNGSRIVTTSDNNEALVVDPVTGSVEARLAHPSVVNMCRIDATADWIFTAADDSRGRVFGLPGTTPRVVATVGSSINNMAIDSSAQRVLFCANDARIYGRTPGLPLSFTAHSAGVLAGEFSPDATKVCTLGGDATIRLWNASTGVEIWRAQDPIEGVRSLCFSPDGLHVAVGMSDSTISIWDVATGARVRTIGGYKGPIRMVRYSVDGALIAGASDDNYARVHEAATGRTLRSFQHGDDVRVARWSSLGDRLLTTSDDGTARVWQVREIVLQSDTSGVFAIAPPPPAYALFTASGDTIDIREVTTIDVRMVGAVNLDLADIDSVRLTCSYDPSLLHRLSATVPLEDVVEDIVTDTAGIRRSVATFKVTLALPMQDALLFSVSMQGTLGQDSITRLSITNVQQIGSGAGLRTEQRSDQVLVRGICRESGTPRLYTTLGSPLSVSAQGMLPNVRVRVTLPDNGQATVRAFDVLGSVLWQHQATDSERQQRFIDTSITFPGARGVLLLSVQTETMSTTLVLPGGM